MNDSTSVVTLALNPAIDICASVDEVVPERKLRCGPPIYDPGGGGINVSRVIHRLGGESLAMYVAGGPTGDLLKNLLDDEGISQLRLPADHLTRENITISERKSEDQYRFVMPGPELREPEWMQCIDRLRSISPSPEFVVLSGSLPKGVPHDFYARCIASLGAGTRVIVDTSGESLKSAVEQRVYLLKPNLRELGLLVGRALDGDHEWEEAAREIVNGGKVEIVVLSVGRDGAVLVTRDFTKRIKVPEVEVKSKVGAGDSMVGGITTALARGQSPEEAAMFGAAAGSAAVMTPGTELCRRDDTERLYKIIRELNT